MWKDIPDYTGLYQASTLGQIKSLIKYNGTNQRILKLKIRKNGYLQVILCKDGIHKHYLVHKLILETFVGPCPPGMETRHLNGIRIDNKLINLKYGTRSENQKDRNLHGTQSNAKHLDNRGTKQWQAKLNDNKVFKIKKLLKLGFSCKDIAKIFSVNKSTISDIKFGRTWKHVQ